MEEIDNNVLDIEDEDTSSDDAIITHPFKPNEIEIETPPHTVGYLIDRIEHGEINMNTDFQREGNLWPLEKQSRLIESILLGLPLPAFYFDTFSPAWDIIDGLGLSNKKAYPLKFPKRRSRDKMTVWEKERAKR